VFSLGVIFYAITTRSWFMYDDKKYFGAFVEQHGRRIGVGLAMSNSGEQMFPDFKSPDYDKCSKEFQRVIKSMLCFDAKDRLSAIECVRALDPTRRIVSVSKTSSPRKILNDGGTDIDLDTEGGTDIDLDTGSGTDVDVDVDDGSGDEHDGCCLCRLLCFNEKRNNNGMYSIRLIFQEKQKIIMLQF